MTSSNKAEAEEEGEEVVDDKGNRGEEDVRAVEIVN